MEVQHIYLIFTLPKDATTSRSTQSQSFIIIRLHIKYKKRNQMLNTLLNLIFIQLIAVFIIDLSGFVDTMKNKISSLLTGGRIKSSDYRIRPFDCSLCMTFWSGLIYLFIVNRFTLPLIAFVCLLSITTTLTKDTFYTLYDLFIRLLKKIDDIWN